ncbi:MAG: CARDB domain-containing protein [Bacteroidota bacterium]
MTRMFIFCLLMAAAIYACTSRDNCLTMPSPPDLVNEFEPVNGLIIPAGEDFEVLNTSRNIADPDNCAGTATAVDVILRIIVEYRIDNFEAFEVIRNSDRSIGSIEGGEFVETNFSILFSQPGQYRITITVDADNLIPERDESNNVYTLENIATK